MQRIADIDRYKVSPLVIKKNMGPFIWKVFRLFLLIGICYIFLFPILYMISVAVRTPEAVNDPSSIWIPRAVSLESIKTAIKTLNYWNAVKKSTIITIGGTLGSLISCSLVGYGFARFKFKEKNILFILLVLTIIVPPQTILISSFINFRYFDFGGILTLLSKILPFLPSSINLIDTPWTFILPALFSSGLRAGLFAFIFRQFFAGLPKELEEAATIDGCGGFRTFLQIMVPLAKPAIITVLLFSVVWNWNDYYQSAVYFYNDMPVSVMLKQMASLLQDSKLYNTVTDTPDQIRTYLQAGCLLSIAPPLVLYIFTQRFFTESIERSGIVG